MVETFLPKSQFYPVPDNASPQGPWHDSGEGIGVWWSLSSWSSRPWIITNIRPSGPADVAGLKMEDRIIAVNGDPEGSPAVAQGETAILTVQRPGRPEPFEVTVTGEKEEVGSYFWITDVYEDRSGTMWFGTRGYPKTSQGIVSFDVQGADKGKSGGWRVYRESDGLDMSLDPHLLQTKDRTLWVTFGSNQASVNRFDGKSWPHIKLSELGGMMRIPVFCRLRTARFGLADLPLCTPTGMVSGPSTITPRSPFLSPMSSSFTRPPMDHSGLLVGVVL